MNGIYRRHCTRHKRRNLALFLSRQTNEPSYDYQQLVAQVEARGWETALLVRKVRTRNLPAYCVHVLKQLKLMAQARTVVIDRYDPVISLLDLACEPAQQRHENSAPTAQPTCYQEFPTAPVVVQLWHAFGAYKYFGFQSIDTPEGHDTSFFDRWRIHRNCSWIVCSGPASRAPFAQAFNVPVERVVCAARPEYFELQALCGAQNTTPPSNRIQVHFAPTLRYSSTSPHPLRDLAARQDEVEQALDAHTSWSFHPLEQGHDAPGNVSSLLMDANVVVTDYSSIVFEAYLLEKPVLFYVPDIETFRTSPGLNIDPTQTCPNLCARTLDELAALVTRVRTDEGRTWALGELAPFMQGAFPDEPDPHALVSLIVNGVPS